MAPAAFRRQDCTREHPAAVARPAPLPVPDPRAHDVVLDYAGMHALVADLVLPGDASMYVMSAMETSRELIRHSYYRYEFATVAVMHSCTPWSTSLPSVWPSTSHSRT